MAAVLLDSNQQAIRLSGVLLQLCSSLLHTADVCQMAQLAITNHSCMSKTLAACT